MTKPTAFLLALLSCATLLAQPSKPSAVELYRQIQKLNFLGSVLYVAAHPDDENTRLIAYMANEQHARTAYLSLTRGDGGQNLIGPELREKLGVIRTQELLEARKIDGGQQFFSRANDFGYSKTPTETLKIWDKEQVLSDVVYLIRKFRPDVIINRFDARTPGTTHGHHTASALLSVEAFDLAGDPKSFPEQLSRVTTWQPTREFFNTNWWFFGSKEKFDAADKTKFYTVPSGVFDNGLGLSIQEIAALSRSRHRSQGFGTTGTRGDETEYLELLKGAPTQDHTNLFEGIDTSWGRVKGGTPIKELLARVERDFDFRNPSRSIPELVRAYAMVQKLDDAFWKNIKLAELRSVIAGCAGLYLEAVAAQPDATRGASIKIKCEAINRSGIAMTLDNIAINGKPSLSAPKTLNDNQSNLFDFETTIAPDAGFTQPYWLEQPGTVGMYRVDDANLIGQPDVVRSQKAVFTVSIAGDPIDFTRDIVYKYTDDAKGEVYRAFDIVPDASVALQDRVGVFLPGQTKTLTVSVKSGKEALKGTVALTLAKDWIVKPASADFELARKGETRSIAFEVTAPKTPGEASVMATATVEGKRFDHEQVTIGYDHIVHQQILQPATERLLCLNVKTQPKRIAYLMGAGDEVPSALRQMGFPVTVLTPEEISADRLKDFDVVMTGIRAYNTVQALAYKQQLLYDFVKQGHTMIAQYNTLDDFVLPQIAPYPMKVSRSRVTEEDAAVAFLSPDHKALNYPNKITADDFKGWKQELGLYFPSEWDAAFTPILSAHDTGESDLKGGLLIAPYGKGNYVYTGLSFFRELPEGVVGAYRLMANLICLPQNP